MIRSFIMPPVPVATSVTCSFEPVPYSACHTPHQHDIPLSYFQSSHQPGEPEH